MSNFVLFMHNVSCATLPFMNTENKSPLQSLWMQDKVWVSLTNHCLLHSPPFLFSRDPCHIICDVEIYLGKRFLVIVLL
jgi:hypothetical protein